MSSAGSKIRWVSPPRDPIFRVARGFDPFEPPPWELAHSDGTFSNRFDDPRGRRGIPPAERFRSIYCASRRAGAFGETIARFRPSEQLLAGLEEIEDDQPLDVDTGIITADWRSKRRAGKAVMDPSLRFADLGSGDTIQFLRSALAPAAVEFDFDDIDLSTVTGATRAHRMLTQEIARYIHDQMDPDGHAKFAGIRYISRLNPEWELWAAFDKRVRYSALHMPEAILADDPGLLEAAAFFGLRVEIFAGKYIEP